MGSGQFSSQNLYPDTEKRQKFHQPQLVLKQRSTGTSGFSIFHDRSNSAATIKAPLDLSNVFMDFSERLVSGVEFLIQNGNGEV